MRTIATALSLTLASGACAQNVIYDTLWIVDEEYMDAGTGNAIGGLNGPTNDIIDSQIADDFQIGARHHITRIVVDIMSYNGTLPAEGIWLQFYPNDEELDKPHEDVFIEHVVTEQSWTYDELDTPLSFDAWRVYIDVADLGIELGEGIWWLNAQPLDIDTTGDWFWAIGSLSVPTEGLPSHVRDGWLAHGNNYRGLWGSANWIPHDFRGNNTLSMRIEGEPLSDCRADLTGDGIVDIRDFLIFLDFWASGDPRADWNGDSRIDTQDVIAYLNDWAEAVNNGGWCP